MGRMGNAANPTGSTLGQSDIMRQARKLLITAALAFNRHSCRARQRNHPDHANRNDLIGHREAQVQDENIPEHIL